MKNVFVTGATGFIGTALCKRLLEEGLFVHGTVRSFDPSILPQGVAPVQLESIEKKGKWETILNDIDTIVHLAARVHVMKDSVTYHSSEYHKVNVQGSKHLALAAAQYGVKRFIFMSSAKVNGEGRSRPYKEADIQEPQDPYGISKLEAEQVLHEIADQTGLEVVILRPPLVYGPGVKANFLRLLKVVDSGIPLPLLSTNNRRSLIYIENLVDAVFTCLSHPEVSGQTFLVSDGEDISTSELIRIIGFALERPAHMFPFPTFLMRLTGRLLGKSAEVERLLGSLMVDCSKIKRELNWEPPYTMDQGLKETGKWYLKRRNISRKGAKTLI